MRPLCPFCESDLNEVWQMWKASKKFDATMTTVCLSCGEIVMVARDGLRKPTTDEHVMLAGNGAVVQARQLWLDAQGEASQARCTVASEFKSLLYASRNVPIYERTMIEGVYWRAAKASYDTIIDIFNEEKHALPTKIVDRLELIAALLEAGATEAGKRINAIDSPRKRKNASV